MQEPQIAVQEQLIVLRHTINYRPFELAKPDFGIDDFDEAYYLASSGATNPVLLTRQNIEGNTQGQLTLLVISVITF